MHQGDRAVAFAQTELARFGYGMPDCRVFRYWEAGFPLKAEGAEMRALVLARGGKAMIALGNFGPAGAAGATKPADQEGGPSLEDYDAGQRGLATAPAAGDAPVLPVPEARKYTVRLQLDLAKLGVPETAEAVDVEARAGRPKATDWRVIDAPARPGQRRPPKATATEPALTLEEAAPPPVRRLAPGVFELDIVHHDFALIAVE